MKYLIILIMATGIFAESCQITNPNLLIKRTMVPNTEYADFCIDGYVWRYLWGSRQGSLSQVLVNKDKEKFASAKECSCR